MIKEEQWNENQRDHMLSWQKHILIYESIPEFDDVFEEIYEEKFVDKIISSSFTSITYKDFVGKFNAKFSLNDLSNFSGTFFSKKKKEKKVKGSARPLFHDWEEIIQEPEEKELDWLFSMDKVRNTYLA